MSLRLGWRLRSWNLDFYQDYGAEKYLRLLSNVGLVYHWATKSGQLFLIYVSYRSCGLCESVSVYQQNGYHFFKVKIFTKTENHLKFCKFLIYVGYRSCGLWKCICLSIKWLPFFKVKIFTEAENHLKFWT